MGLFRRSRSREQSLLDDEDPPPDDSDDWDDDDPEGLNPDAAAASGGWLGLVSKVLAVLVLAGVAVAVIVFAYSWGIGQRNDGTTGLPIVEVEPRPEKVRPEDPGGLEVPYQDTLALNESLREAEQSEPERLLPPPETPQPGLRGSDAAPSATSEVPASGDAPAQSPQAPTSAPESASAPDNAGSEAPEAARAGDAEDTAGATAPETTLSEAPTAAPEAADTATAEPRPARKPAQTQDARRTPDSGAESAPSLPEPSGAGDVVPDGAVLIQLASIRDQTRARDAWARMKADHPNLLSSQRLRLQQVKIAEKGTFWRIRTGPFPNRATADDMCRQLQARGQPCLVVRK